MRIYIVSEHPIHKLEELPGDLLADDIVEMIRDNKTCVVESLSHASSKEKKHIYALTFEEVRSEKA